MGFLESELLFVLKKKPHTLQGTETIETFNFQLSLFYQFQVERKKAREK
jgi:hypothetical protein